MPLMPAAQAAVRQGRKERANPGRDGADRWKYTHQGMVYITVQSSQRLIMSFAVDGSVRTAPAGASAHGCHVVLTDR